MYSDSDIKIAGNKPSEDVRKNKIKVEDNNIGLNKETIEKARLWGKEVAVSYIKNAIDASDDEALDREVMAFQRRLLLSFTATVGFEQFGGSDSISGIAEKSFLDTIKTMEPELYKTSSDTGAFSFYYLAFRRGGEVDRRIGQTFAMLCSHDGDPIYQELGEALYCWFLSVVKKEKNKIWK